MLMAEVVLTLSDNLAREAEANGLLKPESIAAMLRAELRRRHVNKLFAAADRLGELDQPLTETEVEAEIAAARKERHSSDASRR
jgi:hypothetical protein